MDITLVNFRCYRQRTFHLPFGVNLIDGPSGRGKTTILTAIKYGLFGDVTKVTTYGEKKTSVEIKWNDMHLVRTNIPSRLVVRISGRSYEDDAAQEVVLRLFGHHFDITSYMVQKGVTQFFTLPGSQRLLILEQLALLGEDSIRRMKESIQLDLKEKRKALERVEHHLEVLESQLGTEPTFHKRVGFRTVADIQRTIAFLQATKAAWSTERSHLQRSLQQTYESQKRQSEQSLLHKNLIDAIRRDQGETQRLQTEIVTLQQAEQAIDVEQYQSMLRKHEQYVHYQQKSEEARNKEAAYEELVSRELDRWQQERQEWHAKRSVVPNVSVLRKQKKEWEDRQSTWKKLKTVQSELQSERLQSIESRLEATKKNHDKVEQFLVNTEARKCIQSCPSCRTSLVVQSGLIQRVTGEPMTDTEKKLEQDYTVKLPLLKKQFQSQSALLLLREEHQRTEKELLMDVGAVTETEAEKEAARIASELDSVIRSEQINQMVEQQLKRLEDQHPATRFADLKQKAEQCRAQLRCLPEGEASSIPIEELHLALQQASTRRSEIERLNQSLRALQTNLDRSEAQLRSLQVDQHDYSVEVEELLRRQDRAANQEANAERGWNDLLGYADETIRFVSFRAKERVIKDQKLFRAIYIAQLEQLERLMQHMIHAEGVCLEQFIRRVNQKLAWYLMHFFPDQSVQMELCSEKEQKSGKVKNEICVQVVQHHQVTDLKNLSGGEYDRCALAFMLSINELSHSPCLFLDESISSLDMGLSEEVLEVIKDKQAEWKKIVLLISHQANTGFFDHVIKV